MIQDWQTLEKFPLLIERFIDFDELNLVKFAFDGLIFEAVGIVVKLGFNLK